MARLYLYIFFIITCAVSAWITHHSTQDATWSSRQLYPLESLLAYNNQHCQGPHEKLVKQTLQAGRKQGSLASQVAYLSPSGQISACASAPRGETPSLKARYRYASLTKLFTAQAVLTLMAEQALPLNTPLSQFVPEANIAQDSRWAEVTIKQLLTHSAGLDRLRSYDPMTRHAVTPWCPGDMGQLKTFKLDFDPGTDYGYSNLTYCLLGLVVEQLTDVPFTDALESTLSINKFGMQFIAGPYLPDEVQYDFRHTGFYSENYYEYMDFPALASSAGLSGTALGLIEWIAAQRQNNTLTATQHVWPQECDLSKKRACYGYALFPYRKQGNDLLVQVQQGYVFGASSLLIFDEHGGVLVWLGNGSAPQGSASDNMLDVMYELLAAHYE